MSPLALGNRTRTFGAGIAFLKNEDRREERIRSFYTKFYVRNLAQHPNLLVISLFVLPTTIFSPQRFFFER